MPALARLWQGAIVPLSVEALAADADLVFLALPDAAAADLAPALVDAGVRVIDLSGAFRLRDHAARARWYPETHRLPADVAYGLTERERGAVARARLVANPGCYPTATLLALAPLIEAGLLLPDTDVIVDAKSGVSGAGKTPSERTHFSEVHGSLAAYGVFNHRHGAEIEQGAGRMVTFTPHLLPIDRGILCTIYVRVAPGTTEERLGDVFEQAYRGRDIRPPDRRVVARDQARRAHQFLRHRLAGRRLRPRDSGVGHRQPAQGRLGAGRAEHERDARARREDGVVVMTVRVVPSASPFLGVLSVESEPQMIRRW